MSQILAQTNRHTCSERFLIPLSNRIQGWSKNQTPLTPIYTRVGYAVLIPLSCTTHSIDAVIGSVISIIFAAINEQVSTYRIYARRSLAESQHIVSDSFVNLMRAINPHALFALGMGAKINPHADGILAGQQITRIQPLCRSYTLSQHFFHRHITARLLFLTLAVTAVVMRVIDLCIAIPMALIAICLLGTDARFNVLAKRGFHVGHLISELVQSLIGIYNPRFEMSSI